MSNRPTVALHRLNSAAKVNTRRDPWKGRLSLQPQNAALYLEFQPVLLNANSKSWTVLLAMVINCSEIHEHFSRCYAPQPYALDYLWHKKKRKQVGNNVTVSFHYHVCRALLQQFDSYSSMKNCHQGTFKNQPHTLNQSTVKGVAMTFRPIRISISAYSALWWKETVQPLSDL